ncbi:hypothetical protein BRD11_02855, partial [Halobacteriales archaeon SW_12_69_24]
HVSAGASRAGGDADVAADDVEVEDAPQATPMDSPDPIATEQPLEDGGNGGASGEQRASDTNVQVEGIDEPDVLKTTPRTAYYAPPRPRPAVGDGRPTEERPGVRLVNVSDPAAPEVASRLDVSGKLLLSGDTLVVFQGDRILGYDVSDRADPERVWEKSLSDRVVTARLHDGTVYLVTESQVDRRPRPSTPPTP